MAIPSIPAIANIPSIAGGGGDSGPVNLITNGQFTTDVTSWTAENGTGEWTGSFGFPTPGSALFDADVAADSAGWRHDAFIELTTGTDVTASAYFRNFLSSTALAVRIVEYDASFNFLRVVANNATITFDGEWHQITVSTTLGADTANVRVYCNTWGSQTANFALDDVWLVVDE